MRVFRQWVHSDQFYDGLWPQVKNSYNPLFQKFVEQLKEKVDDVPTPELVVDDHHDRVVVRVELRSSVSHLRSIADASRLLNM